MRQGLTRGTRIRIISGSRRGETETVEAAVFLGMVSQHGQSGFEVFGFEVLKVFSGVALGSLKRDYESLGRLPSNEKVDIGNQLDGHNSCSVPGFTPSIRA